MTSIGIHQVAVAQKRRESPFKNGNRPVSSSDAGAAMTSNAPASVEIATAPMLMIDDVIGRTRHGLVDVPLHDLAVEEERRERVAAIVERRVQRSQTDFRLGDDLQRFGVDDR